MTLFAATRLSLRASLSVSRSLSASKVVCSVSQTTALSAHESHQNKRYTSLAHLSLPWTHNFEATSATSLRHLHSGPRPQPSTTADKQPLPSNATQKEEEKETTPDQPVPPPLRPGSTLARLQDTLALHPRASLASFLLLEIGGIYGSYLLIKSSGVVVPAEVRQPLFLYFLA